MVFKAFHPFSPTIEKTASFYAPYIKVYVFSPSEDPWEGSFEDVSDKVELCALPQAIYNTYRRILPKKKDAVVMPEDDALATTEKEEEQFNGMLNFEYDEEA